MPPDHRADRSAATAPRPRTIQDVLLALSPEELGALRASVERQLALARDEVARLEFEREQLEEAAGRPRA